LRLIEAMDLVNKNDSARAVLSSPFSICHDLLYFLDSSQNGGKFNKLGLGQVRDDLRQSSFAGPWWSPEDERADIVSLNLQAQWLPRANQVLLSHELVQCERADTVRQLTTTIPRVFGVRNSLK